DGPRRDAAARDLGRIGDSGGTAAVVAEDAVVAVAGVDDVAVAARAIPHRYAEGVVADELAVFATDDDVVALASGDAVAAAGIRSDGPDAVDVSRVAVEHCVVDEAAVADDDVVALVRVDGVVVDAAEEHVAALA